MTEFLFNESIKQLCTKVRSHAEKPENWHYIVDSSVPGIKREHVLQSLDVQACFSWEVLSDMQVLRYLSVSIKAWHDGDKTRYARPEVVWTLAHHLGFTGATPDPELLDIVLNPSKTWVFGLNEDEGTVCVQEEVTVGEISKHRPNEPEGAGDQPPGGSEPSP